jgi:PKD repeat protein
MKNKIFELFVCLMLMLTFFVISTVTVRGFQDGDYEFIVNGDNTATITKYVGTGDVITIPDVLHTISPYTDHSVVSIGSNAFYNCDSLTSVKISSMSSLNTIDSYAFASCSNLVSMNIENYEVTTIGERAFWQCTSLSSITIPENTWFPDTHTVTIGDYAFADCSALEYVTLGSTVSSIGDFAFDYCTSLTAINVSASNNIYTSIEGILYNKAGTMLSLIKCPERKAGTFTIPDSVITIGTSAVSECILLTSVIIGDNVKTIKDYAFSGCIKLVSLTIGSGVTTIEDSAFDYCSQLTSITIPNSVTAIGNYTFQYCTSLVSMTIGNGVTAIWNYAFRSCTNLTSIKFQGNAPASVSMNWLEGTNASILLGHVYPTALNFPPPGNPWNGLMMGAYLSENNPPVFEKPSPTNGSTGNSLSLTWRISINDPEGDQFSWTIQCSNGQTKSSNGYETNGTKSLSLSGLENLKQYKVWVNATDSTGFELYTQQWYTFTTKQKSSSGDGHGGDNGGIIPSEPQNKKPIANASTDEPYQGYVNSEILFYALESKDLDGNITKWLWDFGDNTNATGEIVSHMYSQVGNYIVTLTVTDNEGATDTDTTNCIIKQPNRAPITPTTTGPTNGTKNTLYNYTALSNDADNDTIKYTFNWGDTNSQSSSFLPNATNYTTNHSWTTAGRYKVTVTVTDNQLTSSLEITVYIDAIQTGEIGYLIDNNTDGRYDAFYSDELQQTLAIQEKSGSYNIDNNGDKKWDYTYSATKGLTVYKEPSPGFEIIILLCAITVSILLWKKKRIE